MNDTYTIRLLIIYTFYFLLQSDHNCFLLLTLHTLTYTTHPVILLFVWLIIDLRYFSNCLLFFLTNFWLMLLVQIIFLYFSDELFLHFSLSQDEQDAVTSITVKLVSYSTVRQRKRLRKFFFISKVISCKVRKLV